MNRNASQSFQHNDLEREVQILRDLLAIAAQYLPDVEDLTKKNYSDDLPLVASEICTVLAYMETAQIAVPDVLKKLPSGKVRGYDDVSNTYHPQEELIAATTCYTTPPKDRNLIQKFAGEPTIPCGWPWKSEFWQPSTYAADLEKARVLFTAAFNHKTK